MYSWNVSVNLIGRIYNFIIAYMNIKSYGFFFFMVGLSLQAVVFTGTHVNYEIITGQRGRGRGDFQQSINIYIYLNQSSQYYLQSLVNAVDLPPPKHSHDSQKNPYNYVCFL